MDRAHLSSTSQTGPVGAFDADRVRDHHEQTGRTRCLTKLSPKHASDPDFDAHYVGTYGSVEEALTEIAELDQRESEVTEHANNLCLYIDSLTPDYDALRDEAEAGYDFVEHRGRTYVFYK